MMSLIQIRQKWAVLKSFKEKNVKKHKHKSKMSVSEVFKPALCRSNIP